MTVDLPEPTDPQTEAAMAYEDALDALHSPREILARALQRATEADDLHEQVSRADMHTYNTLRGAQRSALELATVLASIAQAAVEITEAEGLDMSDPDAEAWKFEGLEPERPDDGPHALACRFTVRFEAGEVGLIGGRFFVFEPHIGWVDATDAVRSEVDGHPGRLHVLMTGRAVSQYNDQVLVITDGGVGMVLPAGLVRLEADE